MSYINQFTSNRIIRTVLVLSLVLAGHWMTNWSTDYLTGVMTGMIVMGLIDYTDDSD